MCQQLFCLNSRDLALNKKSLPSWSLYSITVGPPPPIYRGYVPRPQWMPETANSREPYMDYVSPYIPVIKFNLQIRCSKILM